MRIGSGSHVSFADTARRLWEAGQAAIHRGLERISSGLRINRAADDAAGLAISERLHGQRFGMEQAARNTQDAISLAQTAEGTLAQHHSVLQRMRTIAVQSANGLYSASQRAGLQSELNQLITEIDASAANANFNGRNLLDGSFLDARFQNGANARDSVSMSIARFDSVGLRLRAQGAALVGANSAGGATSPTPTLAATPPPAPTAPDPTDPTATATDPATTDPTPTDPTTPETSAPDPTAPTTGPGSGKGKGVNNGNGNGIIKNGGGGGGGSTAPAPTPPTAPAPTDPAAPAPTAPMPAASTAAPTPAGWALSVLDTDSAAHAIGIIDDAIWLVSRGRTELGAAANAFGHRLRSLSVAISNHEAAYSRIRDADIAYEMSRLVRHQISSQAAASMMAQAHSAEQHAARLLLG